MVEAKSLTKCPLPLRYPGGKYYATSLLEPFWNISEHTEFREPFAGGATIFFSKSKAKRNWLNDIDSELVTTYQVMSDPVKRGILINMLSGEVATKERWREVFNFIPNNEIEIAYKYYYMNRTSFSGKMVSPGWGYREKRSVPPERWHEKLMPCGEKLENVRLTNLDFEDVIKADAETTGGKVLMFVDPPYYAPPKRKHYRNGFDIEDHERLSSILKNTKHKFFLTYDNVQGVRDLYKWANINEVKFIYRVDNSNVQEGSRRLGFELVITNYELPKQTTLFE